MDSRFRGNDVTFDGDRRKSVILSEAKDLRIGFLIP